MDWLDADLRKTGCCFGGTVIGLDKTKRTFSTRLDNILNSLVERPPPIGPFWKGINHLSPTTTWRQILDLERHQILKVQRVGLKTLDELEQIFQSINIRPRWAFKKPKRPYPMSAACSGITEEMPDSFKVRCIANKPHPYKQWQNVAVVFGREMCESQCRDLAKWLVKAANWMAAQ